MSITETRNGASPAGLTELAGKTVADINALVQAEVALAKAELRQEVAAAGKGVAALVVFAAAALFGGLLLAFGACWALALVLPTGAAFAIVGGVLLAVGLPLVPFAVNKLRQVQPLPQTKATLSEVAGWNRASKS